MHPIGIPIFGSFSQCSIWVGSWSATPLEVLVSDYSAFWCPPHAWCYSPNIVTQTGSFILSSDYGFTSNEIDNKKSSYKLLDLSGKKKTVSRGGCFFGGHENKGTIGLEGHKQA